MANSYLARVLAIVASAAALTACSSNPLPSLTTGSLFGSKPDAVAASQAPVVKDDPTTRTLQVSRIAARAQRCGFNFDNQKLKANLMASEGAQPGADVAALGKLDSMYTGAFNGTLKAVSKDADYCSDARTAHIKAELGRHLAGDYTPGKPFKDPNADDSGLLDGLFSGAGSSGDSTIKSDDNVFRQPKLPTDNS